MGEITEQQKLFADEYLKLRKKNQTQAAINAGYSERTAASQASRLLRNVKVLEYLKVREKALVDELQQEFIFDAIQARKVMFEIMTKEDAEDRDKINVAKDFLDRAGFKAIEKIEHSGEIGISERAKEIEKRLFSDE